MVIFFAVRELVIYISSILYVGAITWLLPVILVLAIMSTVGVCTSSILSASARTCGRLVTMAATGIINGIPNFIRLLIRFWNFLRNAFARIMPNWAATILAWVVLVII